MVGTQHVHDDFGLDAATKAVNPRRSQKAHRSPVMTVKHAVVTHAVDKFRDLGCEETA